MLLWLLFEGAFIDDRFSLKSVRVFLVFGFWLCFVLAVSLDACVWLRHEGLVLANGEPSLTFWPGLGTMHMT